MLIKKIIVSSLLTTNVLFGETLTLKGGWELIGADYDMTTERFDNTCVEYMWKYGEIENKKDWMLHIANQTTYNYTGNTFNILSKREGYWVKSNTGGCDILLSDKNETKVVFQSGEIWKGFTYKTITSSLTGKIWLDRNLGATQVCTSSIDTACYGDYYQWGRNTDGHEKKNSMTTSVLSVSTSNVNHGNFILVTSSPGDWTNIDSYGLIRTKEWNPCPNGFKVPTMEELIQENITNINDAYNILKLPAAGYRAGHLTGSIYFQGERGHIWSSSQNGSYSNSKNLYFANTYASSDTSYRVHGFPVRCIKD